MFGPAAIEDEDEHQETKEARQKEVADKAIYLKIDTLFHQVQHLKEKTLFMDALEVANMAISSLDKIPQDKNTRSGVGKKTLMLKDLWLESGILCVLLKDWTKAAHAFAQVLPFLKKVYFFYKHVELFGPSKDSCAKESGNEDEKEANEEKKKEGHEEEKKKEKDIFSVFLKDVQLDIVDPQEQDRQLKAAIKQLESNIIEAQTRFIDCLKKSDQLRDAERQIQLIRKDIERTMVLAEKYKTENENGKEHMEHNTKEKQLKELLLLPIYSNSTYLLILFKHQAEIYVATRQTQLARQTAQTCFNILQGMRAAPCYDFLKNIENEIAARLTLALTNIPDAKEQLGFLAQHVPRQHPDYEFICQQRQAVSRL